MAWRHARSARQRIDRKILVQISHDPGDQFRKPISGLTVKHERAGQFVLAVAVHRCAYKLLGHHRCDMAAIVLFDQSKRKIDSRAGTRRRIKRAILNEMPSGINTQVWETPCNIASVTTMSGDLPAIEKPV